jgi:hypothetical protein
MKPVNAWVYKRKHINIPGQASACPGTSVEDCLCIMSLLELALPG